jgi:predicted metal-dependent hydrolase
MSSLKTVPTHLVNTYRLLQCAFPQGIGEQFYLPLLSILYEDMSDRNLAQSIAEFTGLEYHAVLHDVYRVAATPTFSSELIEAVQEKLMRCNYQVWLAGE